jgi:2-polyprenyl-3-methyl-5-hydroxy-6-metoxy-1,4-benzoquinol methylase
MTLAMERIPEPELMNEAAQAQAYAQADFSEPHTHFVSLFAEKFPTLQVAGSVLDLGCGPADISRRFAQAYPLCRIHGIDGAAKMLELGREANTQAQLAQRIELFEVRLPCSSLPLAQYDVVISNSLLHHLHDPLVLWRSLQQFARPGAPVFIMDLRRPVSARIAQELVTTYAENEPAVLREDFLASFCAAFTPAEIEAQLAAMQLTSLQVEIVSDRHLIIYGRLP